MNFEFDVLETNFKHSSGRSSKTFCELQPRILLCIDQTERYFVLPHVHVGNLGDMHMGDAEISRHLVMTS